MSARMRSSITGYLTHRAAIRRSTRWGAILAVMVALFAAFAVAALAGVVRPPVTGQQPAVKDAGPRYVGPTPDLTAVANAISMRHKSLTILVTVRPGLALTKTVAISIAFDATRQTQPYVASAGNRFLYNAPQGSGHPRRVNVAITLTEDKLVVGGVATFSRANPVVGATFTLPWYVDLDPLFDVAITPLRFTMTSDCEKGLFEVGKSEIRSSWTSPEGTYREKNFSTSKGKVVTINEFAWARQEVSASANLFWPQWGFYESDVKLSGAYLGGFSPPTIKLLPGSSGYVGRSLTAGRGQSDCTANIAFDIKIQVRQYPNL